MAAKLYFIFNKIDISVLKLGTCLQEYYKGYPIAAFQMGYTQLKTIMTMFIPYFTQNWMGTSVVGILITG